MSGSESPLPAIRWLPGKALHRTPFPAPPRSLVLGGDSDYILYQFLSCLFRAMEHTHPARRDVDGVKPENFPVADLDLKAEPVGPEQAAGSIKSHGGGDLAFVVVAGAGKQMFPQFVSPGPAVRLEKVARNWATR